MALETLCVGDDVGMIAMRDAVGVALGDARLHRGNEPSRMSALETD